MERGPPKRSGPLFEGELSPLDLELHEHVEVDPAPPVEHPLEVAEEGPRYVPRVRHLPEVSASRAPRSRLARTLAAWVLASLALAVALHVVERYGILVLPLRYAPLTALLRDLGIGPR